MLRGTAKVLIPLLGCIALNTFDARAVTNLGSSTIVIEADKSTVGNIHFRVKTVDGGDVPDGTRFDLYRLDKLVADLDAYEMVDYDFSENSYVYFENVEFGRYFVRASDENPYMGYKVISIDDDSLEKQHLPKKLLVDTDKVQDNGSGTIEEALGLVDKNESVGSTGNSGTSHSGGGSNVVVEDNSNEKDWGNAEGDENFSGTLEDAIIEYEKENGDLDITKKSFNYWYWLTILPFVFLFFVLKDRIFERRCSDED